MSPPPPTGTTSVSSGAGVLDQLEGGGSLARHHQRIVVRTDELEAVFGRERAAERLAVVLVTVVGRDLGAVAARRLDLRRRRIGRHENRRPRAEQTCRERDGLRVVARRIRDHRRSAWQRSDLGVGAAKLERARTLQALRLEHDVLAERARRDGRRPVCDACQDARGCANVVGPDHVIRLESTPMPSISSSTTSPRCSQRPSPCSRMHPVPTVPDPITSPGSNWVFRAACSTSAAHG